MSQAMPVVAYFAPELPALSATFVYEELLGIERRVPFTVRSPKPRIRSAGIRASGKTAPIMGA